VCVDVYMCVGRVSVKAQTDVLRSQNKPKTYKIVIVVALTNVYTYKRPKF